MKKLLFLLLVSGSAFAQPAANELSRWKEQASRVTIIRDKWGIPHIYGKTDADAVFGALYAQCENDFARVERNYIVAEGRLAEVEGADFVYNDLRVRLFQDTTKAIVYYYSSPPWLKALCDAFADGVNYYLYTHPAVKPRLLKRFQPWMPFLFSEGSIGGDIESVRLSDLKAFYGKEGGSVTEEWHDDGGEPEPKGSNGFAIAPARSASGHALLLINPHTTFYFRSELHMVSEEGLSAYGAATWGQFFIYQGFNAHCGWMHTTSRADVIDEYKETVFNKGERKYYRWGGIDRELMAEEVTLRIKGEPNQKRTFTIFRTHHGPVVRVENDKWIAVKMMYEPLKALSQSFLRTKSNTLQEFKKTMEYYTNSSNNTVYADDMGNIAYWHGDFMPRRETRFDWQLPVDGTDPSTEWQGLHHLDEIVQVVNPATGWIQNCNSTPFTASGSSSPDPKRYPAYMAPDTENPRGLHAVRVLKDASGMTLDKLITAAYDPYLPAFEIFIPSFIKAFEAQSATNDTLRAKYQEPVHILRSWDYKYSTSSVATTLAIHWALQLQQNVASEMPANTTHLGSFEYLRDKATDQQKMKALALAIARLNRDFGKWKMPWGEVNRFQRINNNFTPTFDDKAASVPVAFTSSHWGSLAAYGSRQWTGTKKWYGSVGNSFVAAVEFGARVKAKSIVTGGSSSDPSSPHFNDQGPMYAKGHFKDVLFYPEEIKVKAERTYHPGDR